MRLLNGQITRYFVKLLVGSFDVFWVEIPNDQGPLVSVIIRRTDAAQKCVWQNWVNLDESASAKVSDQLSKHPVFRKTAAEICHDAEKSLADTKVWKIGAAVVETVVDLARKIIPGTGSSIALTFANCAPKF